MRTKYTLANHVFSQVIILILMFSAVHPLAVQAQEGEGIKRQINTQTGKLSFLLPATGPVLPAREALLGLSLAERRADPALSLVRRYGPEFGLNDPMQELVETQARTLEDGKRNVRYQQVYQGIPVLGGELIVHTNAEGDLYSINGEVAGDLTLGTEPTVSASEAARSGLSLIAKGYARPASDFAVSAPELWIFDPALIMPVSRPRELVWRMEVTSIEA